MTTTTSAPTAAPPVRQRAERIGYLALAGGPALWLVAWAIMRLDGHNGPGASWTAAHLFWLFAYALFGVIAVTMMRKNSAESSGGRGLDLVAASMAIGGSVALVSQMIVDLAVGLQAGSSAEMGRLYEDVFATPGVELGLFQVGPALLYAGLLLLAVTAAARRQVLKFSPIAVAAGTAVMVIGREGPGSIRPLEGLGMVALWLGLASVWHRDDEQAS